MPSIERFASAVLERIGRVLGDTETGLTGSQIERLLADCALDDPGPITKRERISEALLAEQTRVGSGAPVVRLLTEAMQPVRWLGRPTDFEAFRTGLNEALSFSGLHIDTAGQMTRVRVATTLSEATQTSRRLKDELVRRRAHAEVYKYCTPELARADCFNIALEASKGLAQRIRELTGLDLDGHKLVDASFGGKHPLVAFNALRSETQRNEQVGLINLMKGVFSAFRNPTAHEPKTLWHVDEQDVLDLLSTLSLLHRRLDTSVVVPGSSGGQP